MKKKLNSFENLENRSLLSGVSVNLSADGVLAVNGDKHDNVVYFDVQSPTSTRVEVDGNVSFFNTADIKKLVVHGGKGDDTVINNTSISSDMYGEDGKDYLKGGGGDDRMYGGDGADIINDFVKGGGNNLLSGDDGNDTLWGGFGTSDTLLGGDGDDVIYDIVGGTNTMDGGRGKDTLIGRGTDVQISESRDKVVTFFPTTPLTNPVELRNGILYMMGDATNNTTIVNRVGDQIIVNFTDATGAKVYTFNKNDVKMLAGIGFGGDDLFMNNTKINSVYYGTAGNDTLIGGRGRDLLKGGADNDVLFGGGGKDDLTGDDGFDYLAGGGGRDILRADALDVLYGVQGKDTLLMQRNYIPVYS